MRKRKFHKRGALFAPVSFLLIVAALIFGLSVFFRVYHIEVTGNSFYSAEEVITASGIEQGDNLFFIDRSTAASRINARLPYVETARVLRSLPNRLEIQVTENSAIACVEAEGSWWTLDRSGKILSEASSQSETGTLSVEGLEPIAPEVGQYLTLAEGESPKLSYLTEILTQFSGLGLQDDITYLDISNAANPSFDYLGRFTVRLGTRENLEYKFQCLLSAVATIGSNERGILDLSIDRRVHLTYE